MYNTKIQELAHKIILTSIEERTPVIIRFENKGTSIYSYQDRIGTRQVLDLYMNNYSDIDGVTGLRWSSEKEDADGGSIFIDWKKVRNITISQNDRVFLKIDDVEFNFVKEIKSL